MHTGYPTRWMAFLVLFAAASIAFTPAAATATQAGLTPATTSADCPPAEIIGVHGTGEGPSNTDPTDSPEIKATFNAFATDEQKQGEYGARLEYYAYPTVSFAAYLPVNWPTLQNIIGNYARQLEAELEHFSYSCPDTPISLVGYSLGALLINDMLSSHRGERSFIDAVELYGDPCWYNPHRDYRGLAQYAASAGSPAGLLPRECIPVSAGVPGRLSLPGAEPVHNKDPVRGRGLATVRNRRADHRRGTVRCVQVPAPVLRQRHDQIRHRIPSRECFQAIRN